jgi:hypothetical protein
MARSALGCRLCAEGAKLVLFVSGECNRRCFYCPLSEKKKGRDVIYANERLVSGEEDIIEEAERMRALGTGITGGEPLMFMERTLRMMRLLKNEFGERHHIHLYTTMAIGTKEAQALYSGGLDEIRFHTIGGAKRYGKSVEASKDAGISAGVELPAIPGDEKRIKEAVGLGIDFLNLNELEFSETNREKMVRRGYDTENGISAMGSAEFARRMVRLYGKKVPINFCSSNFKDGVQLRRRLLRTAKNVAKDYESVTSDGTIIRAVIENCNIAIPSAHERVGGKIYTSVETLESIAGRLPPRAVAYISEVYPTWDALEVEREYVRGCRYPTN